MEFWRIYRLIHSKRWLIAAIMLIAAGVIFAGATLRGQKKMYQAEALVEPQNLDLAQRVNQINNAAGGGGGRTSMQQERTGNISDLIILLRTSNDLHVKTADLMQATEEERITQVQRILERNGFFAAVDDNIEQQAARLVKLEEMTPAQAKLKIAEGKAEARKAASAEWAKARDELGAFAPTGLALSDTDIAARIRSSVFFEPIADPLSSEQNRQVVNLIKIRAQFEREAEATLYTNMLCVAFIDFYTNKSASAANAQITQLKEKLAQASSRLKQARDAEVAYRQKTTEALTAGQESAIANSISYQNRKNETETALREAEATISSLEAQLRSESQVKTTALPVAENPEVRTLTQKVSEAQINFQTVRASNFGEESDQYRMAKAALDSATRELEAARRRAFNTSTVNANYDVVRNQLSAARTERQKLQQRLASLNNQLAQQKAIVGNIPEAQAALADLRREVAISEKNVGELESTLAQMDLYALENGKAGTINILSRAFAVPIGGDISAQRWKLMVYGMILALIFGIALVVAMDALDNSIRTTTDVEKLLGLPISGIIPAQLPDPNRAPRIAYLDPLSPVAEAYRLLRTDLFFTAEERPFHSLMLSTGKPGQGATTTICNLAITMAQAGKKVILVDADLRRPKLHNVFKIKNETGLTSLLNDQCELEAALKPSEIDNLLLLPTGPLPLNPSELLASPRMKALHEELKKHCDYVLFDTPSAIAFSDATILSSFIDATLLVVRANNVPRGSENQVRTMLTKARANIIGVVLNGVTPDHVDSVHYHYHYYPVLTSKNSLGALGAGPSGGNGGSNGGGNGHHPGLSVPLALPGGEDGNDPVVVARIAAARQASEKSAGASGGAAVADGAATAGQTASSLSGSAVPEAMSVTRDSTSSSSQGAFRAVKRGSLFKHAKALLVFIVVGLVVGALVLMLQNSVQP